MDDLRVQIMALRDELEGLLTQQDAQNPWFLLRNTRDALSEILNKEGQK